MFGTVHLFIALLVTMAPIPVTTPLEPSAFLAASRDQEAALVTYFSDDAVWRPERKEALLARLQVAGLVRPKAIIPRLLAHLDYHDDAHDKKLSIPELEYPVYGALKPTTRSHATSYSWEMICGELTPRLHSSQPLSG